MRIVSNRSRALAVGAAALFFAAAVAWNAWTAYGPPLWIPQVTCTECEFDFGERPSSSVFEHVFSLTNRGGAPLTIEQISSSCGCISVVEPKPSQCPMTVPPGEGFRIGVVVNLHDQKGTIHRVITVRSNDPRNRVVGLKVRGQIAGGP